MFAQVQSLGVFALRGFSVTVEADLSRGLPQFELVGLPDSAVKESRDRVRSAIKNLGFEFPVSRITLNLAPAVFTICRCCWGFCAPAASWQPCPTTAPL